MASKYSNYKCDILGTFSLLHAARKIAGQERPKYKQCKTNSTTQVKDAMMQWKPGV